MQQAEALRHLASIISATIQRTPDVLENKRVVVPDIQDALFTPELKSATKPLPQAYRFVDSFLALDHPESLREIFNQFQALEQSLIWGHAPGYTPENVGQRFLDNYCHALLSGPDGPLKCATPLGAFVLFGPDTLYKDHSHTPNEVYLALTDGGEWRVGSDDWIQLEAGQTLFIPSNAVHAIRTRVEPILTFSYWLEPGEMVDISI